MPNWYHNILNEMVKDLTLDAVCLLSDQIDQNSLVICDCGLLWEARCRVMQLAFKWLYRLFMNRSTSLFLKLHVHLIGFNDKSVK